MSEPTETPGENTSARTAGTILREARLAQGVHIAALAASVKVPQRKLESLEADRLDELPDATFTRALAQTVCRALKIDPAPVLALLPQPSGLRLEHVAEGLKEPFRERSSRTEPGDWMSSMLGSPAAWGVLAIIVLTAFVYLMPQHWFAGLQAGPASAPASAPAPAASAGVATTEVTPAPVNTAASAAIVPPSAVTPAASPSAASGVSAAPETAGPLRLRTIASSWIEVHDAQSRVLLSRIVEAGEALALDGATPLRVKIGNARATEVVFRGRPLDLSSSTRDNVARLELQ
jgi:cytoskeleton protein RodZ